MLSNQRPTADPSSYVDDTLYNTQPSTLKTAFNSAVTGALELPLAVSEVSQQIPFLKNEDIDAAQSSVINMMKRSSIQENMGNPGLVQESANWIANLGGSLIGGGGILAKGGSLATRGLLSATRPLFKKLAPDALQAAMTTPIKLSVSESVQNFVPLTVSTGKNTAENFTLALVGKEFLSNSAAVTAFGVPQAITDNYNNDTKNINWGGVADDLGNMGAFGFKLASLGMAAGVLRGTMRDRAGVPDNDKLTGSELKNALESGKITQDQHDFLVDMQAANGKRFVDLKTTQELKARATKILNDMGVSADPVNHNVVMQILGSHDVENLKGTIADAVSTHTPEDIQDALSTFIVHKNIDQLNGNSKMIDGLRGHVKFMNEKLASRDEMLKKADDIVDKHFLKKVTNAFPFSQERIFKVLKQMQFNVSHIKNFPINIPANVQKYIDMFNKLDENNKQLAKAARKSDVKQVRRLTRRIQEMPQTLPKLLTPKEELMQLREHFKDYKEGFKNTPEWDRLDELSQVWPQAKVLRDRVMLDDEYHRQAAFTKAFETLLEMKDAEPGNLARSDNVVSYLEARVKNATRIDEDVQAVKDQVQRYTEQPEDAEGIFDAQEAANENIKSPQLKEDFAVSRERFTEFKAKQGIFENLIGCILGK